MPDLRALLQALTPNAALQSLVAALEAYGLIADNTTP